MNKMDSRIKNFISKNNLLSFSVIEANDTSFCPYCASCYYAFDEENISLIIKSSTSSKHIKLAIIAPNIGVIIAKDSKNLGLLKGVQIKAMFKMANKAQHKIYYKAFPFARLGEGEIFSLELMWVKYTDNKLLLSDKLIWIR